MSVDALFRQAADGDRLSWSRLIDDHDRIAKGCYDLVALTRRRGLQCAAASRALMTLALLVATHLGVEDEVVDLTAIAMTVDYPPDVIDTMRNELAVLKADWKGFVGHWLPSIEPADWLAFRAEAEAMCARLSIQVGRETQILYDGALRYGVVGVGDILTH